MGGDIPQFFLPEKGNINDGGAKFELSSTGENNQLRSIHLGNKLLDPNQKSSESELQGVDNAVIIGGGDSKILQYFGEKWDLKTEGNGLFIRAKPHNIGGNVSLSASYFTEFIPDSEPWEFRSDIANIKTFTVVKGGFEGNGASKGYIFQFGKKQNEEGINETRLTFGVNLAKKADFSLKSAISHVWGEYINESFGEASFSQTGLHFSAEKEILGSILRASGYVLSTAELGELKDGSVLVLGESGEVLNIGSDNEVHASTLSGLTLSVKTHLERKNAELLFSLNMLSDIEEQLGKKYALRYSQQYEEGRRKWSVEILSNGEDEHELQWTIGKFFESFRKDQISLEFGASYNTQEGIGGVFKFRYYLNEDAWRGKETSGSFDPRFKNFSNKINHSDTLPRLKRIEAY